MKGNVWTLFATAIGAGVMLSAAVPKALPSSPSTSTDAAAGVLSQVAPFAGLVVTVAAVMVLLSTALNL